MNQPAPEYPSDGTPVEDIPQPVGTPYKDDTSDGTTAPKASDVASAEDLEPADATPAEQGDDTAVDHDGNDVDVDADGGEQA